MSKASSGSLSTGRGVETCAGSMPRPAASASALARSGPSAAAACHRQVAQTWQVAMVAQGLVWSIA